MFIGLCFNKGKTQNIPHAQNRDFWIISKISQKTLDNQVYLCDNLNVVDGDGEATSGQQTSHMVLQ